MARLLGSYLPAEASAQAGLPAEASAQAGLPAEACLLQAGLGAGRAQGL
jgi:hypothetical protein